MTTVRSVPYHHGNLHAELLAAAVALAQEGGPDEVVMREVSRRAGVSHNAAYRHFADRDALLEAVCHVGMAALGVALTSEIENVSGRHGTRAWARRQMLACGRGYVHFALAEPGLFRTAFAVPDRIPDRADTVDAAGFVSPYEILGGCLDDLVASGAIPAARRPYAEMAAWSAVHGYAVLLLDGPLRTLPPAERSAGLERVVTAALDGL